MEKIIYNIIYQTTNILFIISALSAIRVINRNDIPKYLNNFFFYPLLGSMNIIFYELNRYDIITWYPCTIAKFSFVFFHYIFLSRFIFLVIGTFFKDKVLKYIFIIISFIVIVLLIFDFKGQTYYSATAVNIGLLIYCLFYFSSLFRENPILDLLNDPSFLIISGIFFGSCVGIPIYLFGIYLKNSIPQDIFHTIIIIGPISSAIMYIFFIKAFLCIKPIRLTF